MSENFNIDDISNLASIELSEEEKAKLQKDLQIILEHVDAHLKIVHSFFDYSFCILISK